MSQATIIEEHEEGFDLQLLSVYLMGIAVVVGVVYWLKEKYLPASKPIPTKAASSAAAKKSTGPKEVDLDWLPPHHLASKSNANSPKLRKRKT